MEFFHGVKTTLRYDEMSPLDRAIDGYYKKAKKYFLDLNAAEKAPDDVRKARKHELQKVKKHLENERRLMQNIVDIQAQLEAYRNEGRLAIRAPGEGRDFAMAHRAKLLQEKHHPTELLEKFMRAVPVPKPSPNHSAHHIIPGKGKTAFAYRARVRMHFFGIRINDPDNGAWLLARSKHTPHWSMPEALGHMQYHTEGYEKWVHDKLANRTGEDFIRLELQLIGLAIQQNKLPPEARKKSKV